MLFEMVYKFNTKMERVIVLQQVRSSLTFPPEFEKSEKYAQARRVIRWLLQRNPDDRPTAMELANSKLLPPGLWKCGTNVVEILTPYYSRCDPR